VTQLRKIMLEELERRNYAPGTVEHFAQHFRCSPDKLGTDHIRQYQAAMFRTWKLAPSTVTQQLAALRFLYIQVLKRGWSAAETPYPKKVLHLPQILSQQEVARLIDATERPFQRILVMTLYATGARRAEVAHLNTQLQLRTDPMLAQAYPVYALSDFYCSWLRLTAPSHNVPTLLHRHQHAPQTRSPHSNLSPTAHHNQPRPIQIP
jgi:hypothetical protein